MNWMNSGWCVMKSVAGRSHFGWAPVRINFQEWRYNMGCMTCKNKNITQTMVDCSKYVCDVHFLLIWLLLRKDYTTNNLIKVWHWIDQIIFVYSLSKFLPSETGSLSVQVSTFYPASYTTIFLGSLNYLFFYHVGRRWKATWTLVLILSY